jgi:hypothetical protein
MATDLKTQAEADAEEILWLVSEGRIVTDPELKRRIAERSQKIRQQILDTYGTVEWSDDLIREGRDE